MFSSTYLLICFTMFLCEINLHFNHFSYTEYYTEKNLLVNFTFFIRKFIIFIVTLGHTQNVEFLLF